MKPRLELHDLWAESDRGTPALRGVTLDVQGWRDSGFGGCFREWTERVGPGDHRATPDKTGKVNLDGQDASGKSPAELLERGLSYIPEERMKEGMIRSSVFRKILSYASMRNNPMPG